MNEQEAMENALVASGALWMALRNFGADPVMEDGHATNALWVRFPFLKSRYRVTVTIDPEPEEPF